MTELDMRNRLAYGLRCYADGDHRNLARVWQNVTDDAMGDPSFAGCDQEPDARDGIPDWPDLPAEAPLLRPADVFWLRVGLGMVVAMFLAGLVGVLVLASAWWVGTP